MGTVSVTPYIRWTFGIYAVSIPIAGALFITVGPPGPPDGVTVILLGSYLAFVLTKRMARVRVTDEALFVRNWLSWRHIPWGEVRRVETRWNWLPYGRAPVVVLGGPNDEEPAGVWARQWKLFREDQVFLEALTMPFRGLGLGTWRSSCDVAERVTQSIADELDRTRASS